MPDRSRSPAGAASSEVPAARRAAGTHPPTYVFESGEALSRYVAELVASVIRERNAQGQPAVLGLPTGSTPVGTYRELVRMHQVGELDFSRVVTFQLDEYVGLGPEDRQSYRRWMEENFYHAVNIPPENIHGLDGRVPLDEIPSHCRQYEEQIRAAGGIDLVLLGIGQNGHVAFNEPFSPPDSRTRLVTLDSATRRAAAADFFGEENVPTNAITMGLGTILEARKIVLMALGEHKARIIRETVEGPVSDRVPASHLQQHSDVVVLVDAAAGKDLTSCATPWLVEPVQWTEASTKRAVLWLCEQTGKALLKLNDDDFLNHHLHDLLWKWKGGAESIAQEVFGWMQRTIVPHPAGTTPKRIICFSPHPDDDVISMGGTLIRLVEDGHDVHIAYMTSGNIAVFDHDVRRVVDLVVEFNDRFGIDREASNKLRDDVHRSLRDKRPGQPDSEAVLTIKSLIRWSEARAGALAVGVQEEHLHFLDLPFYRTGTVAKLPIGEADVAAVAGLLEQVEPDQIYVAGDLSDPHGTHRMCAEAVIQALEQLKAEGKKTPEVLLYRGAWQEYALHEIDLAVPLSPSDLERKRKAIFMHESQKDEALFPGSDPREFWQRAEDRNRETAEHYNRIGLPEYIAMEAFVYWDGRPL